MLKYLQVNILLVLCSLKYTYSANSINRSDKYQSFEFPKVSCTDFFRLSPASRKGSLRALQNFLQLQHQSTLIINLQIYIKLQAYDLQQSDLLLGGK